MIQNLYVVSAPGYKINKNNIHKIISGLKEVLKIKISFLQINIVSGEKITEINRKHLNHNYSTDVITFNYSGSNELIDGEIFISFDDALLNSEKYKVKITEEICRLIIHGILHLKGYNDKNHSEKVIMRKKENLLHKRFRSLFK